MRLSKSTVPAAASATMGTATPAAMASVLVTSLFVLAESAPSSEDIGTQHFIFADPGHNPPRTFDPIGQTDVSRHRPPLLHVWAATQQNAQSGEEGVASE